VFPLGVGVAALTRVVPPARRLVRRLFVPLAAQTAVLLAVVLLADDGILGRLHWGVGPWATELGLVAGLAAASAAAVAILARGRSDDGDRVLAGVFALTSAVSVMTFAGSRAIPGVGIAETFPYFLLPPLFAGTVAALAAGRWFPRAEGDALPVAFFAAGWGVTIGADVLWQPPLYGVGAGGLYAIGGAGVLDLVYLSGFLGLLGAWGTHRLLGRPLTPVGEAPGAGPSPSGQLRTAYVLVSDGEADASVRASAAAAQASALQAHRLLGTRASDPARPWFGLSVPGWVVSDQTNLESVARAGTRDLREAWRAYATARALVRLGEALGRPRFATIGERVAALTIDLALLGAVGAAVLFAVVVGTSGGLAGALNSPGFNAAIYGVIAVGFLYFVVAEVWFGATVGKWLLGIEVRDRALGPVGAIASLVRNAPLLPVLTLGALGLGLAIAVAQEGFPSSATFGGLGLPAGLLAIVSIGLFVLAGVGLSGSVGVVAIALTSERQRVGDLWAGTWVVRRLRAPSAPPSPPGPAARSA